MVARISTIKNIAKALNYNEQKVQGSKADLLLASGFLKEVERLTFYDKLEHFRRLQTLNERVITNALHVSLNFDPSERLREEQLQEIACAYMKGIGFGKQPYLVYRHEDAGHPHIHIVSINIQPDGSRISMHNLGRNQSETTRKRIEEQFGLIPAEKKGSVLPVQPLSTQKIQYGKGALKQAISNVLKAVLIPYNYTSLEQLNAVLKGYNLVADRGEKGSRLEHYHGLQYQVLSEKGEKVGIPIKASSLHSRPTLSFLEKRFSENALTRPKLVQRTRQVLDWILQKPYASLEALQVAVEKEGIQLMIRRGKEGVIYGLTYVDVRSRLVINGSELGKRYSAKAITTQLKDNPVVAVPADVLSKESKSLFLKDSLPIATDDKEEQRSGSLIELLVSPEQESDEVTAPLRRRKRKKKRTNL